MNQENDRSVEALDGSMEELGFHRVESIEEALEPSNQVIPVDQLSIDELDMFAEESQTIAEAVENRNSGFIPVPRKQNGVWFQLKRMHGRTEMLMCTEDGERVPTGVGWNWKR